MEELREENTMNNDDYFANGLLDKLEVTDPILAAFEAQAVSREVGFDFDDFDDVVPRALDEIRETKEAFIEEGPEGREHFGDEVADIMFSLVNLARHAGIDDLPTINEVVQAADEVQVDTEDTLGVVEGIGVRIAEVADAASTDPASLISTMRELLHIGLVDSAALAQAHGFDPESLLRENVKKYLVRCQAIETLAAEDNKTWASLAANSEIVEYWKKAKKLLK